jgi:hypothetical protein
MVFIWQEMYMGVVYLVRDLIGEKYIILSEGPYLMRDLPDNEGSCW